MGGPGAPDPEDELFRFGISGTNASETPSQESVATDGFAAREAAPGRAFPEAAALPARALSGPADPAPGGVARCFPEPRPVSLGRGRQPRFWP